jgi:hypothetical protein
MATRLNRVSGWSGSRWDPTVLGLGILFAVLIGISLWASIVAQVTQYGVQLLGVTSGALPLVLVSASAAILGLALGSVVYARHRGIEFALSLPDRGTWPTAIAVVLAPAVLAVGVAIVSNAAFGVTLSAINQQWMSAEIPAGLFVLTVVLPAAFVGVGYGFLFCGLVCERVEDLFGQIDAVVAASLVGFFWLLPVDAVQTLRLDIGGGVELLASIVFGVAFAMALGIARRHRRQESGFGWIEPRHALVLAVAVIGVAGVATELTELPRAIGDLLWVVVLGVAVLGYQRTRSVWVSALSIVVFSLTTSAVVYVESFLGLAGL